MWRAQRVLIFLKFDLRNQVVDILHMKSYMDISAFSIFVTSLSILPLIWIQYFQFMIRIHAYIKWQKHFITFDSEKYFISRKLIESILFRCKMLYFVYNSSLYSKRNSFVSIKPKTIDLRHEHSQLCAISCQKYTPNRHAKTTMITMATIAYVICLA